MNPTGLAAVVGIAIGLIGAAIYIIAPMFQRQPRFLSAADPADTCPICLDNVNDLGVRCGNCGHSMHKLCFEKYKAYAVTCPYCRHRL